jgi:hypothetical protein
MCVAEEEVVEGVAAKAECRFRQARLLLAPADPDNHPANRCGLKIVETVRNA